MSLPSPMPSPMPLNLPQPRRPLDGGGPDFAVTEEQPFFRISVVGRPDGPPIVQMSFAHIQWHMVPDRAYDLAGALAEAATRALEIEQDPTLSPDHQPDGTGAETGAETVGNGDGTAAAPEEGAAQ